jgi:hypothetical protein
MVTEPHSRKSVSHHIFPVSASLLGLCFVLLGFITGLSKADKTLIDEVAAGAIVFFLTASILSYAAMRSGREWSRLERAADIIFLAGLCFLTAASLVLVFKIIH